MAISSVTHVFLVVKQLNKPRMYASMSKCLYDHSSFSIRLNKVRQKGFKVFFLVFKGDRGYGIRIKG